MLGFDRRKTLRHWGKRAFDISAAAMALVLLAPVFGLLALLLKSMDKGPIFYSHQRVGLNGTRFGCLKFRTMRIDSAARLKQLLEDDVAAREEWDATRKLKNDPRITTLGQVLRSTSLDELPQLLNVLRGDMSLVGPRPITADEMPRYGEYIGFYLAARPGLTGKWQISGRNDVSYDARVKLDVEYYQTWSILNDFAIIAKTVPILLSKRGSY
ncbi:sugar transferase [Rhizobium halophytocola]